MCCASHVSLRSCAQVAAGERQADAWGIGWSNPVNKSSGGAELTRAGAQTVVRQTFPAVEALIEDRGAWFWTSISSSSYQTAAIVANLSSARGRALCMQCVACGRQALLTRACVQAWASRGWCPSTASWSRAAWERLTSGRSARRCPSCRQATQRHLTGGRRQVRRAAACVHSPAPALGRQTTRSAAGTDGTPNESVADVLVRVRQVLSICETQYSGETVVLVASDSSVLSVAQAALQGIDLRQHWALAFRCASAARVRVRAAT